MTINVAELAPGERIPLWSREGTFYHWNRFHAVNSDFAGHHMDDDVGRHEGFTRAFISAPFSHAYLHAMLREWLSGEGRIVTVDMRLKNPLLRGRTLEAGGEITTLRPEGEEVFVDLEIWQIDDEGTQLGIGTATVALPGARYG
jgi:acyl dehydratase